MIFADKLINLRKKSGWSQEDLAYKMDVSRQSVSKWESAQSIPDLKRIVQLSELFGVSIDYLLKDEIDKPEQTKLDIFIEDSTPLRRVSMEEASSFLHIKEITSKSIAYGIFLCILSPICLIVLGAISETPEFGLTENAAGGIGMIILLIFVAFAAAIFISNGSKTAHFKYFEKEVIETEYGVTEMVQKAKEQYKNTYVKNIIIGTCMCILSLIPLFAGIIINENNTLFLIIMISILLILAGIGVVFFVRSGIVWASFEKLLQEGDYTKQNKSNKPIVTAISGIYWLTITAVYISYSFTTNKWEISWIIFVVSGVLFPAIIAVIKTLIKRK